MKGAVPHGPAAFPAPCTGISPPSQKRCGSIRGLADSRIEGAEGIGLKEKTGCCILFKETGMSWTEKGEPEFNAPLSTGTAVRAGALRHFSRNPGVETLEIFKTDRLDASLNRKRALLLRSRRMRLSGTGRIKALRKEIWPSSNAAREAGGEGTSVRDGDIFRRDGSPRHRRCQRGDGDLDASAIPASLQRLFTASREKGCLQDPTRRKIRRHASWRIRHSPGEAGFATRRGFPGGDVEARGDGRRSLRQRFGCARRRSINGAQRASPEIGKRLSCPFRRVDQ